MLAGLMENRGKILALDPEPKRLRELETRVRRSGTTIITAHARAEREDLKDTADLILVDAPCSGVGTIRRNPWMKWSVTESLVDHYAQLQSKILEEYSSCVKPGGKLVYSTCSLFRKENEQVIEAFLAKHPEFVPAVPMTILSQLGIEEGKDSHEVKLLPHKHGTDGFFIAVLQKKG
jgi:16S rRNA (cytosine967-C5)-methyltransferase